MQEVVPEVMASEKVRQADSSAGETTAGQSSKHTSKRYADMWSSELPALIDEDGTENGIPMPLRHRRRVVCDTMTSLPLRGPLGVGLGHRCDYQLPSQPRYFALVPQLAGH